MLNIPIHFDDLLKLVGQLSTEQKQLLRESLENSSSHEASLTERVPNLHPGAIWTSDDFDDPLPDEFWLGEDA